jgi:hypothetical protein
MKLYPLLLLPMLLAIGCGDDDKNPVAPDPDLVGTWTFIGSDIPDVIADNLEAYLQGLGVSNSEAETIADELEAELEEEISDERSVMRFDTDGTYCGFR